MKVKIGLVSVLTLTLFLATLAYASSLDEEIQKLKQAGIPTTLGELNPPAVSDSENAALVYQRVFDLMDKNKGDIEALKSMFFSQSREINPPYGVSRYSDIPEWSKWTEEQKRTFPSIIEKNKEISGLLEKAVAMQRCRFPIDYKEGSDMAFNHGHEVRLCAYFMAIKATIEAEKGETEAAFKDCLIGLKIRKAVSEIPSMSSQFVRWSINKTVLSTLGTILNTGDASESLYRKIIEELDQERNRPGTSFALKGRYPTISSNFKAFKKDPLREMSLSYGGQGYKLTKEQTEIAQKYASVIDEDEILAAKTMLELVSAAEKPYWVGWNELGDALGRINAGAISPEEHFLTIVMFSDVSSSYLEEAKFDARFGAVELGLANRIYRQKHDKFADSLRQLTPEILPSLPLDPFTGKDYIYRKKDKGFIIYSLGDNLKDDGGVPQFSEQGKKGGYDIVWEDKGAGAPIMIPRPVSLKSLKGDSSKEMTIPRFAFPTGFPPFYAGLSIEEKTEGKSLAVYAVRELSANVFEGGYWNLIPDGKKIIFSGDIVPQSQYDRMRIPKDGYIFVYNVETEKITRLAGKVSMVYDRKTGKWTVSGSIVPK